MNFDDYAELRRRAEKRLTVASPWLLLAFQCLFYGPMVLVSVDALLIPVVATVLSYGLVVALLAIDRQRTAANRSVRRTAIDAALTEALEQNLMADDPEPRELRLLASLLDDDMKTRAGISRVSVRLAMFAAVLWPISVFGATRGMNGDVLSPQAVTIVLPFFMWLAAFTLGVMRHQSARKRSNDRIQYVLAQTGPRSLGKRKYSGGAPWWQDEDGEPEKAKHSEPAHETLFVLADDGELVEAEPDEEEKPKRAHQSTEAVR